jgi:precorrin-2/cobalt-factor-2 C20-methyltransferase
VFGVGVGPGDPDLLTLKAARILSQARVVAYFAKRGNQSHALTTAQSFLHPEAEALAFHYPYTVELPAQHPEYIAALASFYDRCAEQIRERLDRGLDVAVLCEGDPLFYGSYVYLHDRLAASEQCQVIAGITSFAGCAAGACLPIVTNDRSFSVVPGTLPELELEARLAQSEAVALIKLGHNFGKVKRVLTRLGRLADARYFEYGTTTREYSAPLSDRDGERAPYFALIIVPARGSATTKAPATHAPPAAEATPDDSAGPT